MICSNSLSGQSFTDKLPPEGIIVDAQLVKTESQISRTGNTIYTVNYLNVNRIFSGDTPFDGDIPVLTRGGSTKEGVLVVSHALQFHYDYNYLLALELREEQNADGYAFTYSTGIDVASNGNPNLDLRQGFENALNNWCANTDIKFKVNNDNAFIAPNPNDQINAIAIGNTSTFNGIAALSQSQTYFSIECDDEMNRGFIMTDFDITVSASYVNPNNGNANQDRLQKLFEHELGHAHLINHALSGRFR